MKLFLSNSISKFKHNLNNVNSQTLSIIKIMLFFNFSSIVLNSFFGIIIYQLNNSLLEILIYSLIMIFICDLTFLSVGIIVSVFSISMKKIYYFSMIANIVSYIYLSIYNTHIDHFYIYGVLHGLSIGSYWLSLHTYELTHTKDKERDFYASVISIGNQILNFSIPFFSTIIFFISMKIFNNSYILLFYILPLIYVFSLIPLSKIKDFKAQKLDFKELKSKLFTEEGRLITTYSIFTSFKFGNLIVLNSYVVIHTLHSLFNASVAITIFSFISILISGLIANYIKQENRLKLMKIGIIGITFAYIPLYFDINIFTYVWWVILLIIFLPLYEISARVIDLYSMEKLIVNNSFYTGMLYRSFVLWMGRIISLSIFIFLYLFLKSEVLIIFLMITLLIISYIVEYILAKKLLSI